MQTLFEKPGITIMYDIVTKWLYVTWRGEHDDQSSLAGCVTILNKIRQTKSNKILNDSSQVLDGWSEVVRWIGQEFFQALADEGVVAIAWVTAHDWPARADINKVIGYTTRPIVDTFEDIESAYNWLRAVPDKPSREM